METWSLWKLFFSRDTDKWSCISEKHSTLHVSQWIKRYRWRQLVSNPRRLTWALLLSPPLYHMHYFRAKGGGFISDILDIYIFLSYPQMDDRAGPWKTAMNAACALPYISWQLYIGHVTSIVFHCFQGRPYHLAPLTSLWRRDLPPPPIRTALPIDVAFSEINLSIIWWIGF